MSELLDLPFPSLPSASQKSESILLSTSNRVNGESDDVITSTSKWEDEEERRFYEDIQDLKEFVPSSVLGTDSVEDDEAVTKELEQERVERARNEARTLEEALEKLDGGQVSEKVEDYEEE